MKTILQFTGKSLMSYLLGDIYTYKLPRFKPIHKSLFQIIILFLLLTGPVMMASINNWKRNSTSISVTTINRSPSSSSTSPEDLFICSSVSKGKVETRTIPEKKTSTERNTINYALPTAVISGLTASQSICSGANVTLSGVVSDGSATPIYAVNGSTIAITIPGIGNFSPNISGGVGQFTITFPIPTSVAAGSYTATYSFTGDANLAAAIDKTSTLIVSPPTVGTVSTNQSICSGSTPGNITVTSFSGVLQWQQADNAAFTTNMIVLGGSSSTLNGSTIGALTATKYFRAVVTNGVTCPTATSTTITATVTPAIVGNSSGADISICENTSTTLTGGTVSGGTGTYTYLWESSNALAGPYSAAAGTNNTANYTTAVLTTASLSVYFRRTVTSGSCTSVASGVHVTVNSTAAVGVVSADQTICAGSSPTSNITVASATGTIQWQQADDSAFTTNLTNKGTNATTLTIAEIGTLNATKYFRAKVTSGGCPAANSATVTVTVNSAPAAGTISGNQTICSGNSPASNVTISSVTGTIQWQSADDNAFTVNTANIGTNAMTLTPTDIGMLIANKYIRAQVSNGVCTTIYSLMATITVNAAAEVNAGPDRVMCAFGSITLAGNIGGGATSAVWSAPSGSFGSASNVNSTYTPSITSGTVILTLSANDPTGPCPAATSTMTVTVDPSPATAGVTICPGGSGSLTSSTVCPSGAAITSDFKDAGAGANTTGIGNTDWNNAGNIISNNNSYATVTLSNSSAISRYLIGSNYSFNIPATATILGIQANVGKFSTLFFGYFDRIRDNEVKLVKNGTIVGANKAKTTTNWTGSEVASSYGGTADLWGTTWTAADINNSNFGLAFSVQNNTVFGISYTASVDYIEISVTYSVPGGTNWYTVSSGGTLIGSGTPFNPVGVANSGLADTNTAGTTIFYGESSCSPGCRTATNFVINSKPNTSIITGSATVCANATGNVYSVTNTVGSTYNWTVPAGATITAGLNTNSITVTFGTTGGNVGVTETNAATCTGTPVTTAVTISTVSASLSSSDADNTFCSGTSVTFTAGGGTNYNFRVGGVSVQNTASTTYTTTTLTNNQVVEVIVTNASGCTATSTGITNTVSTTPTAGLTSNDPDNAFCAGTSVIFTATGGTNYNFRVAGVSVQNSTAVTYTTTTLTNGQVVDVIVTNASGCTATSSGISNTVHALPTPGLTSNPPGTTYCAGTTITFTGSGGTLYNFRVASVSKQSGASSTYAITALPSLNGQVVDVIVTDSFGCTTTSSGITPIISTPTIGLTSSDTDNRFCSGTSVTFTATGGVNYNFIVAGASVQNSSSATFTTTSLTNGQVVKVTVTNASGCTATNTGITNTVDALPIAGLTSNDADNTFCTGTSVTFTASGGTNYNFRVAGSSIQNGATTTYTTTTLTNGQVVDVIVTNASGCTATSSGITNTVSAAPLAGLTSNDPDNTFCTGTSVTFTASGGTSYNFRISGTSVQSGTSTTYTTTALINGQVVDVIVTNGSGCIATSTAITNTVNALPIANLTSNDADNIFCSATSVTFTASGGTNYNFRVAGASVQSGASTTYVTTTLTTGQVVDVIVTNASGCTATSSGITNTVNTLPTAGLTSNDTDNTFCSGTSITFIASGGTNYNFRISGSSIQNSTTATFTTSTLTNGQVIDVIVTNGSGCSTTSVGITNTVNPLPIAGLTSNDADNIFCTGTTVIFSATGGTNYNFRIAGSSVQNSTTATYTTTALTTGQIVDVIVSTASGCVATSPGITNTVNPQPSAPTLGTITQPTCTLLTGSAVLNGLPSGNWIINPGNISGTGSSTTISGLANGSINFTVTDATGCISLQIPVVISGSSSKRWLGSNSTDWFTDSNWLPAGVPDANTCVLVPNNVVTVYVSDITKTAYANTLTVANGGKLEITTGNILIVTNSVTVDPGGSFLLRNSADLIQINNSNNAGTINSIRNSAPMVLSDYTYWSSPTSGSQTLLDFSPNTNPKYFLSYTNGWQYLNASNTVFDQGVGYAIIAPDGTNASAAASAAFQFNGTPNNGIVNVPVIFDPNTTTYFSSKLIGNPYPSALDADKFIVANTEGTGTMNKTISGTLYFWTHNQRLTGGKYLQSDYAAYNLTGGTINSTGTGNTSIPKKWIASGQGFVVETKVSGNVTFTNDMRTTGTSYINSNFYKNTDIPNNEISLEKNRIWLNLTNSNDISVQTLIGYIEKASNGYDPGFDGKDISFNEIGLYSLIENNRFIIQGRALPLTDSDKVVLGYKTNIKGNFTLSIDAIDGIFAGSQNIFIEDKLLNVIHNLKASPYTFSTDTGTFDDRFVLRYTDNNLSLNVPNNSYNKVIISSKNQQIKIQSSMEYIEHVFIYDMLGRTIYKNMEVYDKETLISNVKSEQFLIIKVALKNGQTVVQKLFNQ